MNRNLLLNTFFLNAWILLLLVSAASPALAQTRAEKQKKKWEREKGLLVFKIVTGEFPVAARDLKITAQQQQSFAELQQYYKEKEEQAPPVIPPKPTELMLKYEALCNTPGLAGARRK